MSLETFLRELHFGADEPKRMDGVDWDDAPLPYKLYRGLPSISLSAEVPLTLEGQRRPVKTDLQELGHFLWYVFGLAQFSRSRLDAEPIAQAAGPPLQSARRFVPSGGGLYPSELYVYARAEEDSCGIYHYDAAHHRLVLLRKGNFDSFVTRVLGNRCDASACFATVFVSTMYWKNFFKYDNFAYRLQGLDAGIVLGQLLEVAKRFGYEAGVHFQFLDRAVHHLLGVSDREESVYAVIPLSVQPAAAWFAGGQDKDSEGRDNALELCGELPALRHDHYVRSRRIKDYPLLIQMNEASRQDSVRDFRSLGKGENSVRGGSRTVELPCVPRLAYDLAVVCRKRYSPERDFVSGKVSRVQLASLLHEATASFPYRNDLDEDRENPGCRVSLYSCLHNVEDIPDGAYQYDPAAHALRLARPGDHRRWLQAGMTLDNVNLLQVPLCFHVAGDRGHLIDALGYRGYRIQQMEAGMLAQRLLLAAVALGMGGHPLLGYEVSACDELYGTASQGTTSLIQIPVGPYHHRPRLQGSLHS